MSEDRKIQPTDLKEALDLLGVKYPKDKTSRYLLDHIHSGKAMAWRNLGPKKLKALQLILPAMTEYRKKKTGRLTEIPDKAFKELANFSRFEIDLLQYLDRVSLSMETPSCLFYRSLISKSEFDMLEEWRSFGFIDFGKTRRDPDEYWLDISYEAFLCIEEMNHRIRKDEFRSLEARVNFLKTL